jgi:hypothetical protein
VAEYPTVVRNINTWCRGLSGTHQRRAKAMTKDERTAGYYYAEYLESIKPKRVPTFAEYMKTRKYENGYMCGRCTVERYRFRDGYGGAAFQERCNDNCQDYIDNVVRIVETRPVKGELLLRTRSALEIRTASKTKYAGTVARGGTPHYIGTAVFTEDVTVSNSNRARGDNRVLDRCFLAGTEVKFSLGQAGIHIALHATPAGYPEFVKEYNFDPDSTLEKVANQLNLDSFPPYFATKANLRKEQSNEYKV